jgi:hypothetical protein
MSKQVHDIIASGGARVVEAPVKAGPRHQVEVDRNFELPISLYAATVGLYLGFLAIMAAAFGNPGLIIPMAIFVVFVVGMFGVPAVWTQLKKNGLEENDTRPLTVGQFEAQGIMTHTGRLAPRDAKVQVLILPVLIVMWGLAVVTIAAVV